MAANKIQVGYIEAQDGAQFEIDAGTAAAPGLVFDDSAATGLYSPGTGQLAFSTSSKQTALRILADGKVGVDCSPTVAFEVNGTIKASAIDAPIEGTLDDWIVHAGDSNTKFGFPANDTFTVECAGLERLRVDLRGNMGLGATSIDNAESGNDTVFAIRGKGSSYSGRIEFQDSSGNKDAGIRVDNGILDLHSDPDNATANSLIRMHIDNGEVLRITKDGEFGFNTGNVIRENIHAHKADSTQNYLRFTNTTTGNGTTDGFNIGLNADEEVLLWNFEDKPTIFATNNTERLLITNEGKVLIGNSATYSPNGLLHVVGDDNSNGPELYLQVNNNNTTDNIGAIWYGNNVDKSLVKLAGHTHTANNTADFTVSTSSGGTLGERLRIDSAGMSKFTRGSTGTVAHFYANARECNILLQNDAQTWKIVNYDYGNNGTDNLGFHDGTADRLVIAKTGKIGINNTNPDYTLDVRAPSGDVWVSARGGTNQGFQVRKSDNTLRGYAGNGAGVNLGADDFALSAPAGNLILQTGGTAASNERLRITSAGVVQIDQGTSGGNRFKIVNDEISLLQGVNGTGDSYEREGFIGTTRVDSGSYPFLRLAGQGGLKFCVDANSERLRIDSNGHLSLRNAGNSHQELQWYNGTTKSASIGWGNGSANWEFKHFRGDSQAGAPYANIDFWTGDWTNPTRALRITEDGMLLLGETNDDGMSSYDLGMKNGRVIRHRNAAGNAWINTFGLDSSNNIKIGWGGSPSQIHFGISGVGDEMVLDGTSLSPFSNSTVLDLGTDSKEFRRVYYENAWPKIVTSSIIRSSSTNQSWYDTGFSRGSIGGLDTNGTYIITAFADTYNAGGGNYSCHYTWIVGMRNQSTNQNDYFEIPLLTVTGHSTNGQVLALRTIRQSAGNGGNEWLQWKASNNFSSIDNSSSGRILRFSAQRIGRVYS